MIFGRVRAALVLASLTAAGCAPPSPHPLVLATTTSVDNSGLLAVLLPAYREQTGAELKVVTPGSGIALEMLKRGDADVAISHAPVREAELLRDGPRWIYRKIMFNDFVIVGPPDDPARVKGSASPEQAMLAIAASKARFISRGDSSGTHGREQELWTRAGVAPVPDRLVAAGSGMGATLRIAGTLAAYTLTDRATFSQHSARGDLVIVFEGGDILLNAYAVIVGSAGRPGAAAFADWLADGDGRRLIEGFRTAGGAPAFTVWPRGCPRESPSATPCASAGR